MFSEIALHLFPSNFYVIARNGVFSLLFTQNPALEQRDFNMFNNIILQTKTFSANG